MNRPFTRRMILFVGALLIVVGGTTLMRHYLVSRNQPVTRTSDEVRQRLNHADIQERYRALGDLTRVKQPDAALLNTLAEQALTADDIQLRASMVRGLANTLILSNVRNRPALPFDRGRLDQLMSLFVDNTARLELRLPLARLSGATMKWQDRPEPVLARMTVLLQESPPDSYQQMLAIRALGMAALYQSLPEKTLLVVTDVFTGPARSSSAIEAGGVIEKFVTQYTLPESVVRKISAALGSHESEQIRILAVHFLAYQSRHTGKLPSVVKVAAKTDASQKVRRAALNAIASTRIGQGDSFEKLLDISFDQQESAEVRRRAVWLLLSKYNQQPDLAQHMDRWLDDPEPKVRLEAMAGLSYLTRHSPYRENRAAQLPWLDKAIQDTDATVRARAYGHAASVAPEQQALDYLDQALADPDERVREMVARALPGMRHKKYSQDTLMRYYRQVLADESPRVLTSAVDSVRYAGINDEQTRNRIQQLAKSDNAGLRQHAKSVLEQMQKQARSPMQKVSDVAADTKHHGMRLFWLLALVGILVASGFSLYFFALIIAYVRSGSLRSLGASAALLAWLGLTGTMVGVFFFGAFSFGHNSLVPPKTQFGIDLNMVLALLVFSFVGWVMKRLVRLRETSNPFDFGRSPADWGR